MCGTRNIVNARKRLLKSSARHSSAPMRKPNGSASSLRSNSDEALPFGFHIGALLCLALDFSNRFLAFTIFRVPHIVNRARIAAGDLALLSDAQFWQVLFSISERLARSFLAQVGRCDRGRAIDDGMQDQTENVRHGNAN